MNTKLEKKLKRLMSGMLIPVFILVNCIEHPSAFASGTSEPVTSQNAFSLPASFGKITESHQGSSDKSVVFIQDSHTSLEAQENIAKTIRHLVSQDDFRLVLEEGYSGPVPSDEVFDIRDATVKEKVSSQFLNDLRLGGAEYAHINRTSDFRLVGIEDQELYSQNVRLYAEGMRAGDLVRHDSERIVKVLEPAASRLFPRKFYSWWKIKRQFRNGRMQFPEYICRSAPYYSGGVPDRKQGAASFEKEFPSLASLRRLITGPDEKENQRIVGKILREISSEDVFDELAKLEESIVAEHLLSEETRTLYRYLEGMDLVERLSRLQVSRKEFERYQLILTTLRTREILKFLQRYDQKPFILSDFWEEHIQKVILFYLYAMLREDAIRQNLSGDWKKCIVVFGGFHADFIRNVLKEEGYSYAVITPAISASDPEHERRYQRLMGGGLTDDEQNLLKSYRSRATRAPNLYFLPSQIRRELVGARTEQVLRTMRGEGQSPGISFFSAEMSLADSVSSAGALFEAAEAKPPEIRDFAETVITRTLRASLEREAALPGVSGLLAGAVKTSVRSEARSDQILAEILQGKEAGEVTESEPDLARFRDDHFLFRYLSERDFQAWFSKMKNEAPAFMLEELRRSFGYSTDELRWFLGQMTSDKTTDQFGEEDWARLYRAMVLENRFIQQSRFGGFRRVEGIKRWRQPPAPLSLRAPTQAAILRRLTEIYGFSQEEIRRVANDVLGEGRFDSLSARDLLLVHERLNSANKKRFAFLDRVRYRAPAFLPTQSGVLFRSLDLAVTLLFTPLRWSIRALDLLFLRFYRIEFIYEHSKKGRDFLGRARSETLLRQTLQTISKKDLSVWDRFRSSAWAGFLRLFDRSILGSLVKATLITFWKRAPALFLTAAAAAFGLSNVQFPGRSSKLAVLAIVVISFFRGIVDQSPEADKFPLSASAAAEYRQEQSRVRARILSSRFDTDLNQRRVAAVQLLALPPQEAAGILRFFDDHELIVIAQALADPRLQDASRMAALDQELQKISPARSVTFRIAYEMSGYKQAHDTRSREDLINALKNAMSYPESAAFLRAVAAALVELDPGEMAVLLSEAKGNIFFEKVFAEAAFSDAVRKERLFVIRDALNPGGRVKLTETARVQETHAPGQKFVREALLNAPAPADEMPLASRSSEVQALALYWQETHDEKAVLLIAKQYEWLVQNQQPDGSFAGNEREGGVDAPGGTALFKMARVFTDVAEAYKGKGDGKSEEQYRKMAADAGARAVRTSGYVLAEYQGRLQQKQGERSFFSGTASPDFALLMAEAFRATQDSHWYEAVKHVSGNILKDQIVTDKRFSATYREVPVTRYSFVRGAANFDLFEALRAGAPGYKFSVDYRVLPAFRTGYNERLKGENTETGARVISRVLIKSESGELVDTLEFRYDDHAVLHGILSAKGLLRESRQESVQADRVTVYQNDVKTGTPFGFVYQYVYNRAGQLQYILVKQQIDLAPKMTLHDLNVILKGPAGELLKQIPEIFRPEDGLFRDGDIEDSPVHFDHMGRTLYALREIESLATSAGDWKLASNARSAAFRTINALFAEGRQHVTEGNALYFYDEPVPDSGQFRKVIADAEGQAQMMLGLSRWSSEFEQAHSLLRSGMLFFDAAGRDAASIRPLLAWIKMRGGDVGGSWTQSGIPGDALRNVYRYGKNTSDFKFAKVRMETIRLQREKADAIFLRWDPVPQAGWYLVRDYQQDASGQWTLIEKNDQWVQDCFLMARDASAKTHRFVVMGFTADPALGNYGPFQGVHTYPSEPVEAQLKEQPGAPSKPRLVLPKRHSSIKKQDEWIDLAGGQLSTVLAAEMKKFPRAQGAEWEIAADPDFLHPVKKIEEETFQTRPSVFLNGLPDGRYYIRVRLWSNPKEKEHHEWMHFRADHTGAAEAAAVANGTSHWEQVQLAPPGKGFSEKVLVRDSTVIEWPSLPEAGFYRVRVWYQDGEVVRYKSGDSGTQVAIVNDWKYTRDPFIDVRTLTPYPVNRIEIIPCTGDPRMGGIPGPGSGAVKIPEIPGVKADQEVRGIQVAPAERMIRWHSFPGAKVYRITTIERDGAEEVSQNILWSLPGADQQKLEISAKYVRVQAWSDTPEKGGKPLSKETDWIFSGIEVPELPQIDASSVQTVTRVSGSAKVTDLSFDRVKGAGGYIVHTRNRRGGEFRYWVPQPAGEGKPRVQLVMDADRVEITAAERERSGLRGRSVTVNREIHAFDGSFTLPFRMVDENVSGDLDGNGIREQVYFFSDPEKVPAEGMKVLIQYSTQSGNGEVFLHPASGSPKFFPDRNADRIRSRVVKSAADGALLVSDWSSWQEISFRVTPIPIVTGFSQPEGADSRVVTVGDIQKDIPDEVVTGYQWESRVDFSDPEENSREYRTAVRFLNGRVHENGTKLYLSGTAKWVRAKAVIRTHYGEREAAEWSDWYPVAVTVREPEGVTNVEVSRDGKIRFDPHPDSRVTAYRVEASDEPFDGLHTVHSYVRHILREDGVIVVPNNEWQIPVHARYVRVTPMIEKGDDDRILGRLTGWIPVEVDPGVALEPLPLPRNDGPLIVSQAIAGAKFYEFETRDGLGQTRVYTSGQPWVRATGSFEAYRVRPLIAGYRNNELVRTFEGDWTPWVVAAPFQRDSFPPSPENLSVETKDGDTFLSWSGESTEVLAGKPGGKIFHYNYVVELEDRDGNRTIYPSVARVPLESNRMVLNYPAVRARVKAVDRKIRFGEPRVISESDWSPWVEIGTPVPGMPAVPITRLEGTDSGFHLSVSPVPGAARYIVETVNQQGNCDLWFPKPGDQATYWFVPLIDIVSVRVIAVGEKAGAIPDALPHTPDYQHRWTDIPGRTRQVLDAPRITKSVIEEKEGKKFMHLTWDAVPRLHADRPVRYQVRVVDENGFDYGFKVAETTEATIDLSFQGSSLVPRNTGFRYLMVWGGEDLGWAVGPVEKNPSPFSELIPISETTPKTVIPTDPLQMREVVTAPMFRASPVWYTVTVTEKADPTQQRTIVSERPFLEESRYPKGRDQYEAKVARVTAFEFSFVDLQGETRRVLMQAPELNFAEHGVKTLLDVRCLTDGEVTGRHGEWSDPVTLNVAHTGNLLAVRSASDVYWAASFSDGATIFFSKETREPVYGLIHGKRIEATEIPSKYRLDPGEVFERGSLWKGLHPATDGTLFYRNDPSVRNVLVNSEWGVSVPAWFRDHPFSLIGLDSRGSISFGGTDERLSETSLIRSSKPHTSMNAGSVEMKWLSRDGGVQVVTRRYLAKDVSAGISEILLERKGGPAAADYQLALAVNPDSSTGNVRVIREGDLFILLFGSGQMMAVANDRVEGWYLGAGAAEAERTALKNQEGSFEGAGEGAVLYLKGTTAGKADPLVIVTGKADSPEAAVAAVRKALAFRGEYEAAFASISRRDSRDASLPGAFMDHYLSMLNDEGWNPVNKTYRENIGSGTGPANSLWTTASWIGNSSLAQMLNLQIRGPLLAARGNDLVNDHGETLLEDRIIPNAEWLLSMQMPTDSFYMKGNATAMRQYKSEDGILNDNQQVSAVISRPQGIIVKRGYEPLDGFTISGSGFQVKTDSGSDATAASLNDSTQYEFHLPLEEDARLNSDQPSLDAQRVFDHRSRKFTSTEHLSLRRGEYALRYQLSLEAHQPLEVERVSVALSHLNSDRDSDRNSDGLPGFQGDSGLVVPGVNGIFKAQPLFHASGLTEKDRGQWIDLMALFHEGGTLSSQGKAVRDALKQTGAIGMAGWDKAGLMYLQGGIDYDNGFRVMVKLDTDETGKAGDKTLKFTDLRVEMPVEASRRTLKAGESYRSPQVYFSNFWVRMGVTDDRGMPEDLKFLMHEWIRKIDGGQADGISMESDYAYTDAVIALWNTAEHLIGEMKKARASGDQPRYEKYKALAARCVLAAMRGTVSSRDVDRSIYDPGTGRVREGVLNSKGIMRFYGTFVIAYEKAANFSGILSSLQEKEGISLFTGPDGKPLSVYEALIAEAREKAAESRRSAAAATTQKERNRFEALAEIYVSKQAEFEILKRGLDLPALETMSRQAETTLGTSHDPERIVAARMILLHAQRQIQYVRSLPELDGRRRASDTEYWRREVLGGAALILKLQEMNPSNPNYGGFFQNESPSKMHLDDNGTKLAALRVAYEAAGQEIQRILRAFPLMPADLQSLERLYQLRKACSDAAEKNISRWVRVDPRDHYLYAWESRDREMDFDTQRTPYGNAVYRFYGLGSWMDLIPAAKDLFDRSAAQYTREGEDGRRGLSPRGVRMYGSENMDPANGDDTSVEVMTSELMALWSRAAGGSYARDGVFPKMKATGDKAAPSAAPAKPASPKRSELRNFAEWLGALTEIRDLPLYLLGIWGLVKLGLEVTVLSFAASLVVKKFKSAWLKAGKKIDAFKVLIFHAAILLMTGGMAALYIANHDLSRTVIAVLTVMSTAYVYMIKGVVETVVRYFKIGRSSHPNRFKQDVALDYRSFRQSVPFHLATVLSVPLLTRTRAAARISHGDAGEEIGALQSSARKNLAEGQTGLLFHINDNSPDAETEPGFNPSRFHEDYVRGSNRLIPGNRFFYTHQSLDADRKLGVAQNMDSWWYALRQAITRVMDGLWSSMTPDQQLRVKRVAYGTTERLEFDPEGRFKSGETALEVLRNADGTLDLSFVNGTLKNVTVPDSDEIKAVMVVEREDGLTALLPFFIRREGGEIFICHYNEDPESDNVLIREVLDGTVPMRAGLLPLEKEQMIEAEARALLYRFWAARYGSQDTRGDDPVSGEKVTSGTSSLEPALAAAVAGAIDRDSNRVDELFGWRSGTALPGGVTARLSEAMTEQSLDYFENVADVEVTGGNNLEQLSSRRAVPVAALFPEPFAGSVRAWTDTRLAGVVPAGVETVPFSRTRDRAVPGDYYRFSSEGTLEIENDPVLRVMDETARFLSDLAQDAAMSSAAKELAAEAYLKNANPVLRRILEVGTVKKDYRVRYNGARGRTEVLEEEWIMFQYENENGKVRTFFRPERKLRFDSVVGHIPSVGPLTYAWRFDNDTAVDEGDQERGTLSRGALIAGHPANQPVMNPQTGQTVAGYAGMVLPISLRSGGTLWADMERRNRRRVDWDLINQWDSFREVPYTGKGIENLTSSEKSKTQRMASGFYLSHDMLESGFLGPGDLNSRLKQELQQAGLLGAFLQGRSHPDFAEAEKFVLDRYASQDVPGHVVFTRYGRPLSVDEFRELMAFGMEAGGMGLLTGLYGYEDAFENHTDNLFKTQGQWMQGDWQWLHSAWLGIDVRGTKRMPGAMPGYIPSNRRTLDRKVVTRGQDMEVLYVGQEYQLNPLNDVQKSFISKTVEEDQRPAVGFLWIIGTLILAAVSGNIYTLHGVVLFSVLSLVLPLGSQIAIMKFSRVLRDTRQEGLTVKNAAEWGLALIDLLTEVIIVSGINMWKGLVNSLRLMLRAPSMKWVTAAEAKQTNRFVNVLSRYAIGALIGFSVIGLIIMFHPTMVWLLFGSVFLASLILGPFFSYFTSQPPSKGKWLIGIFFALVVLSLGEAYSVSQTMPDFTLQLMRAGRWVGMIASGGLLSAALFYTGRSFYRGLYRGHVMLRRFGQGVSLWLRGIFSVPPAAVFSSAVKKNMETVARAARKMSIRSVADYLVRGYDRTGVFSNRYKALGNLALILFLGALFLIFPSLPMALAFKVPSVAILLTALYTGLFFPLGFWALDKILTPGRAGNWLNPLDYVRTLFHTVAALTGNGIGLILKTVRIFVDLVRAPRDWAQLRAFIQGSAEPSGPDTAVLAVLLGTASTGLRKVSMQLLATAPLADEKFRLLVNSGRLDEDVIGELAEVFFAARPGSEAPRRSESREADDISLGENAGAAVGALLPASREMALYHDLNRLNSVLALDARSVEGFSDAQKLEILKTAGMGRATVIIYNTSLVAKDILLTLSTEVRVRMIPEGLAALPQRLLSNKKVAFVVTERYDTLGQITRMGGAFRKKAVLYRQIQGPEEGLITAALLDMEYGDKYHIFRDDNGVCVLIDTALLGVIQGFLAHELVSQSA